MLRSSSAPWWSRAPTTRITRCWWTGNKTGSREQGTGNRNPEQEHSVSCILFFCPCLLLRTPCSLFPVFFERKWHGISAASGLPELWIAGRHDGGLDHGRDSIDQQLLQAAGPERDPVHGAAAAGERSADGAVKLFAADAAGNGHNADRQHRRSLHETAARRNPERC